MSDQQQVDPAVAAAWQNYAETVDKIVQAGNERYGTETFSELATRCVNNVLPPGTAGPARDAMLAGLNQVLSGFDAPELLVEFLAENPEQAKRLAQMTPHRAAAEAAKVYARLDPNSSTGNLGAVTPAYRQGSTAKLRDITDPNVCEGMSDKQFEREWARTHKDTGGWFVPGRYRHGR